MKWLRLIPAGSSVCVSDWPDQSVARLHPSELRDRFTGWRRAARLAVPIVLGAVMALAHEPWVPGFAALMLGLVMASLILPLARRRAAWFGWLLGLGYFAVTLRWIVEPFLVDLARHGWMAPFALILMAGGLALFWALAAWFARWLAGGRPSVMLWLAVTLTLAELARAYVFTGFPWGMVGYGLIGELADVLFPLFGPHGANLFVFGMAGGIAYCLHRGWTLVWPGLVGVLFALIGLNAVTATTIPQTENTVRIIQPNAPQHLKWDPEWMPVFYNRALEQTASGDVADAVIWPETSVPALLNYAEPLLSDISAAARGAPVLAGAQRREGEEYFNSAVLIEGEGIIADVYDKAHLVPFGEYIPFAHVLTPLGLQVIVDQVAGFAAGDGDGLMQIEGLGLVRVLICYEGIFAEEIQRGEQRPEALVIITNDAWFGTGAGPRQHLTQARARALEQGVPVIRSANTGISAVIDPRGEVVASLALNAAG
ncbi:MAG: apolipoprotein N-acyltransferase, partial [Pseudomonadota bacterium]